MPEELSIPSEIRTVLRPGEVVTSTVWPKSAQRLHIICIGGAGMSAVARLALDSRLQVSGSDAQEGQFLSPLRADGAEITVGFAAENLPEDTDVVVVSTAVRADNPEVLKARELGIPVVHRATALAGLLEKKRVIAIAGTHGKTTTTAMTVMALRGSKVDPAFAVGAKVDDLGQNAGLGSRNPEWAVVEADESDGSFLAFSPEIVVITNQEADHLDHYGSPEHVRAAFEALMQRVSESGTVVVCADDPGANALGEYAAQQGVEVVTYGTSLDVDWQIQNINTRPDGCQAQIRCAATDQSYQLDLAVTGNHNVLNAVGSLAAAVAAGFEVKTVLSGLRKFHGASRRFELRGTPSGVSVYDDYAHHPREVEAALASARAVAGGNRVFAVFQPHLFSRTKAFAAEFAEALSNADQVLLLPIYAAREDDDPTVTSQLLIDTAESKDKFSLINREDLPSQLAEMVAAGDVVMMIGAGDIVNSTVQVVSALGALPDGA